MSEHPLLTIGVPVYNEAGRIARCLASLRDNLAGIPDVVVKVSDNASTDATVEEAMPFTADPRFVVERRTENVGAAANFAGLLATARSGLFMWFAGDDRLAAGALAPLLDRLRRDPGTVLAFSRTVFSYRESAGERLEAFAADSFAAIQASAYGLDDPAERVLATMHLAQGFDYAIYGVGRTDLLRRIMLVEMAGRFTQAEGILAALLAHGRFAYAPESVLIKGKLRETAEQRRNRYHRAFGKDRDWPTYAAMIDDLNLHTARDFRSALATALDGVGPAQAAACWRRFERQVLLCYGGTVLRALRRAPRDALVLPQPPPPRLPQGLRRLLDLVESGLRFGPGSLPAFLRRRDYLRDLRQRVAVDPDRLPAVG